MAVEIPTRPLARKAPESPRGRGTHREFRLRLFSLEVRFAPYAYVAPFFVLFAAFGLFPLLYTIYISFTQFRLGGAPMRWTGLDNYRWLFSSDAFWNALWNTFTIAVISTVPQLLFSLGLAHLLNYNMKVRNFFRISMIMPYATSLVAAALVFNTFFANDASGIANYLLSLVGAHPVSWTNGNWTAQIAISVIVTWHWTGYNALIYLAGMQSISTDLYESASLDGASRFGQFLHVTLPGLRPTILFTIVVSTIGATQLFTEPFLFAGNASGGALGQYQTLTLFMYQQGFQFGSLGRAATVACVSLILIIGLVLLNTGLARWRTRERPA